MVLVFREVYYVLSPHISGGGMTVPPFVSLYCRSPEQIYTHGDISFWCTVQNGSVGPPLASTSLILGVGFGHLSSAVLDYYIALDW